MGATGRKDITIGETPIEIGVGIGIGTGTGTGLSRRAGGTREGEKGMLTTRTAKSNISTTGGPGGTKRDRDTGIDEL